MEAGDLRALQRASDRQRVCPVLRTRCVCRSRNRLTRTSGSWGLVRRTCAPQVITLKELFEPEGGRKASDPEFGLNTLDVLRHISNTEQQSIRPTKPQS